MRYECYSDGSKGYYTDKDESYFSSDAVANLNYMNKFEAITYLKQEGYDSNAIKQLFTYFNMYEGSEL